MSSSSTVAAAATETFPLTIGPTDSEHVRGFGKWKDFVHDNYPWLEHRNHSSSEFSAEVSAFRLGNGMLTTISAGSCEVIRTKRLAERSEEGFIKVMWQMAGQMHLEQDQRQVLVLPGQATVCDTARPYRIQLSDKAHFAVLMLPYVALPGWETISQRLCGSQLAETGAMRAALGALLALTGVPQTFVADAGATVSQAIQLMLTSSMHRSAMAAGGSGSLHPRLNKAQQHILEHIGDPNLDADGLAEALCMSRRSLYMLFKEYKLTPGKMIHDIRLQRCMDTLSDPAQKNRKITDIAFDHGFGDYATFSRLFKAQYGVTPSEYRMKSRTQAVGRRPPQAGWSS
nr:helix-turn-helix domain-containing protein [Solimonas soli]